MADRPTYQIQVHPHNRGQDSGFKNLLPQDGPSASQIIAVAAGLPIGGTLLGLAGLTLIGTIIGLAVAAPLFLIFSPVLIPAAIAIALAVTGFLTSGAFGLMALASFSWFLNYLRNTRAVPDSLDDAKRRMADAAAYVGQKTKDAGQEIQVRAHDAKRNTP